jgi:hypothetical protein
MSVIDQRLSAARYARRLRTLLVASRARFCLEPQSASRKSVWPQPPAYSLQPSAPPSA